MYGNLPEALQALDQWVVWKASPRKGHPGKVDKIPIDPASGKKVSAYLKENQKPFALAMEIAESDELYGLGFVFTEEDPFCGVDLDDCAEGDSFSSEAMGILDELNSYTESSVSGNGLHVIVEATLPEGWRKKRVEGFEIEVYHERRFFACTGNTLGEYPDTVEKRQSAIDQIHARYASIEPSGSSSLTQASGEVREIMTALDLEADPSPPLAKLETMRDMEKFEKTWRRKREKGRDALKDPSASGYCLSLANQLVEAGWSDQEIYDTLRFWRDKEGEAEKRPAVIALTIAKARAYAQDHLDADVDPSVMTDAEKLDWLSRQYGIKFLRFLEYKSAEESSYSLETELGTIRFPAVRQLRDQPRFHDELFRITGVFAKRAKESVWKKRLEALYACREILEVGDESTEAGFSASVVEAYLSDNFPVERNDDSVLLGDPICSPDGRVAWISQKSLRQHMSRFQGEAINQKKLCFILRRSGYLPETLNSRKHGTTRGFWRVPEEVWSRVSASKLKERS